MTDTRLTELADRMRAGEALSASKLNRLIDTVNALERRRTNRANDAGDWVPCTSLVDAQEFSIVGLYDGSTESDGPMLMVTQASEDHEMFGANEAFKLVAGEQGWVKIINDARPCEVRCLDTVVFLQDLKIEGFAVAGDMSGTGTGSGSYTPFTPLADLWAMSTLSDDGRVQVMASKAAAGAVVRFFVKTNAGWRMVTSLGDEQYDPDTDYTLVDSAHDGMVFPVETAGWGPQSIVSAVYLPAAGEAHAWCIIDGGLQAVMGTRSSGGVDIYGQTQSADLWCDEVIPNGTAGTLVLLVNNSPLIIGACCSGSSGTGTGS